MLPQVEIISYERCPFCKEPLDKDWHSKTSEKQVEIRSGYKGQDISTGYQELWYCGITGADFLR